MSIIQMLEAEHSKKQTSEIVERIGTDQKKFDELFLSFMNGEPKVVQRAGWPLSYAVIANPSFITKHYPALFKKLKDPAQHDAVHRHIMKMFSVIDTYPEKYHGALMDQCLRFIEDPKTKVAIQAYSFRTLTRLCKPYPEIIPEIELIIDERMPDAKAAFKASAKQYLKKVRNTLKKNN